mmetsp:Transcript_1996/g.4935  ORF Transcript_1996/g.4935 Transcript_1996/m.4935 type:complete len:201 (+) Transcript_1996:136-738(+)
MSTKKNVPPIVAKSASFLAAAISSMLHETASATDIKWTSSSDPNDEAANAPKSQRYWDENNIKRPDYAKTDAEVAAERMGLTGGSTRWSVLGSFVTIVIYLALLAAAMVAIQYGMDRWKLKYGNGNRLGGEMVKEERTALSKWVSKLAQNASDMFAVVLPSSAADGNDSTSRSRDAEARNARLSRFDTAAAVRKVEMKRD